MPASLIQDRFRENYYGEVNSHLRWCINDLNVSLKGIILRDPYDCLLSAEARGHLLDEVYLSRTASTLQHMDRALEGGALPIRFKILIADPHYLMDICHTFGILDFNYKDTDTGSLAINANPPGLHKKQWGDLPVATRSAANEFTHFFRRKYF
jgi:hypothetical protein